MLLGNANFLLALQQFLAILCGPCAEFNANNASNAITPFQEISIKFDLLAVCVDFKKGPTIFVKEAEDITRTRNSFVVKFVLFLDSNGFFQPLGNTYVVDPQRSASNSF